MERLTAQQAREITDRNWERIRKETIGNSIENILYGVEEQAKKGFNEYIYRPDGKEMACMTEIQKELRNLGYEIYLSTSIVFLKISW
jgi:hypothetical protein